MKQTVILLMILFPVSLFGQAVQPAGFTTPADTIILSEGNQEEEKHIYNVRLGIDLPIAIAGTALTRYGFKQIENKKQSSPQEIMSLDYERDVAAINRWTSNPQYSAAADKKSDYIFYSSFALGLIPALDKNINKDYGRIFLMYWEALAITGTIYAMTAGHVEKYRPLAYSEEAPMSLRLEDGSKNSFPGGHPSLTATASFFVAKVFSDYYPHRKGLKITLYSSAAALTLANAYLRWDAGKHFPTDLAVGMTYGTLVGILVPELHKIRDRDSKLSFRPYPGGLHMTYTIK